MGITKRLLFFSLLLAMSSKLTVAQQYYPLKTGNKFVYEYTDGSRDNNKSIYKTTIIRFDIKEDGRLNMKETKFTVYDILGREIQTLVNEQLQP